jgi:signal transduction histidine kinase
MDTSKPNFISQGAYESLEKEIQQNHRALMALAEEMEHAMESAVPAVEMDRFREAHSKLVLTARSFEERMADRLASLRKDQQDQLREKLEELEQAHASILERHAEMEQQKEALLDQADYLHEANETITAMHAEVQNQKEEILRKNEELLNLNNEKNNLIGIVAHDLKSPLNQVKGLVSIIKMKKDSLDEDTLSMVNMIENSILRLSGLIGKILDVEAIESRQLNLNMESVNLAEVLHDVTHRYEADAAAKGIVLHRQFQDDCVVKVDKAYLGQVVENLLSNAIKFSTADKQVFVSLVGKEHLVEITVKDEGPGISDEDKKKLFGKYQKLTAQPTGNETSTGLGLSIVKKFVEAMGGTIRCESTLDEGASFIVSFTR